jgi:hypothetical protein
VHDATDTPAGAGPVSTVPARPDGWPDLLGRRPLSSAERDRLRAGLGHLATKHDWVFHDAP